MRIIFTEGFLLNDLYQGLSYGGYCVLALSHFFPLQCFHLVYLFIYKYLFSSKTN